MRTKGIIGLLLALGLLTGVAPAAAPADAEPTAFDRTPPRLSFADGQVSFWRPGAQDWVQAQVNTPLAPGDELSTGSPGNLEIQIGARAFVRAWANTQLGLANQEPDFLQFRVTAGHAAFDLRTVEPGHTVEVDTPHAAFTIDHPGYYRVDVTGERTAFITRRAGRATVTAASGESVAIAASEEVVIEGQADPRVASYVAPPLDDWDRWNYARTDRLLDAVSARYVAPGTYGARDLDPYGTWRVVPTYGPIWVPTAVPAGWVPYSTGSWTLDPVYGWTWVDAAPWGWAPYHYGRWCFVDGFWAWAPGPMVARPVYAPALVAFFGGPSVGVSLGPGGLLVGWVALGWGEPVVPWWGREGFVHEPSWRGWGGPRIVNNVVITNTIVVNVQNITVYRNTSAPNAVVAVTENRFGRGPITGARIAHVDAQRLQPIHTAPQIVATPASFAPTASRGVRPPEASLTRSVVATRPPSGVEPAAGGARTVGPAGVPPPAPRLVSVPRSGEPVLVPPRPPFGRSTSERPMSDRTPAPVPPRLGPAPAPAGPPPPSVRRTETLPAVGPSPATPPPAAGRPAGRTVAPPAGPSLTGPPPPGGHAPPPPPANRAQVPPSGSRAPAAVPAPTGRVAGPPPSAPRAEAARPPAGPLPGEPANGLAPTRVQPEPPPPGKSGR